MQSAGLQGDGDIKRREETRKRSVQPADTLFVVNFSVEDTGERDLTDFFAKYGKLVRVQIKRTYAFIQFSTVEEAMDAQKATHLSRFMGKNLVHTPTPIARQSTSPFKSSCTVISLV